jgi:hypothetical protein
MQSDILCSWPEAQKRQIKLNMLCTGSRIYLLLLLHQLNQQFFHVFLFCKLLQTIKTEFSWQAFYVKYTMNAGEMLCPKGKKFLKLPVFLQTQCPIIGITLQDTGYSVSLKKCVIFSSIFRCNWWECRHEGYHTASCFYLRHRGLSIHCGTCRTDHYERKNM